MVDEKANWEAFWKKEWETGEIERWGILTTLPPETDTAVHLLLNDHFDWLEKDRKRKLASGNREVNVREERLGIVAKVLAENSPGSGLKTSTLVRSHGAKMRKELQEADELADRKKGTYHPRTLQGYIETLKSQNEI